jgi:3-deoxy-D-manno-octulosonic-acid transferase
MALVSLALALLIPRHPEKGNETRLVRLGLVAPAE